MQEIIQLVVFPLLLFYLIIPLFLYAAQIVNDENDDFMTFTKKIWATMDWRVVAGIIAINAVIGVGAMVSRNG